MMESFGPEYWEFEKRVRGGYTFDSLKIVLKRYYKELLNYLINKEQKVRLLDVGCGFGYFLKYCEEQANGWELYGIDISEYAIDFAKKILESVKLMVADANEKIPFNDNYFDIVTMFDVIEHVRSPYDVLKECYRILKPNGLICITTPNLNALEKFWKGRSWHGYIDPTHIYLFTPDGLEFLVRRVGFKIETVKTPFHPLPNLISKITSKMFKRGGQILLVGRRHYE